jgi:hypothetical protein
LIDASGRQMARADQGALSASVLQLVAQCIFRPIGSAIADIIDPPRVLFENHRLGRAPTEWWQKHAIAGKVRERWYLRLKIKDAR